LGCRPWLILILIAFNVLVDFSIRKSYFDEVWCDIIPMDACHVLLGRPWRYGRRVTHDGYFNTYSFVKDGKKITLTPLAPHQMPKTKPSKPIEPTKKLLTLV